ncbi:acyl-CoA synthetase (NDP forming) [Tamaricihabitans halophyticus]|uniref:Acyl-CoA synthetase (NDP forming) n=1 Tax=Tamaricihabitans halophyticus TaxID=1262583 RepID=A0A4R2QIL3_9PSEU|nr:acetate--CoA ligase family protein [Tamaricihabitans halophyticus]TCP46821.1 acyl-CoA synthetase (NDP forming) [Tamaricihabitans halophyticus]
MSVVARASRAESIRALFNPTSIALVGATDKSGWSLSTFVNLRDNGFTGPVYLVNPRAEQVHGQQAHSSLSAIGAPVDLVYVMVPTAAVLSVLREGERLGIRQYVVLTAGFGEIGAEGARREAEVHDFAVAHGLTVLGPNGNGFINAAASITPYGLPIPAPLLSGSVGVVLQSGALASAILTFSQARNIGLSLLTAMGNETVVSVNDVLDYLIDDPRTKVIALFLESVRHPAEFAAAARRAAATGKPIVVLKIGSSKLASRTAQAHTGALVGDDAVVDAAFRQLGVLRVRSLEDLLVTAGLLTELAPLRGTRIGVVSASGGASEIIADRAEEEGLDIPAFAETTRAELDAILPEFATAQNPLDVTGYVVVDRTLLSRAMEVVSRDPGIDLVVLVSDLPRVEPANVDLAMRMYQATVERVRQAPVPVVVVSNVLVDVTAFGRGVQHETGFPYVAGGIEHGMTAIGAAARWSAVIWDEVPRQVRPAEPVIAGEPSGMWTEQQAAALLADNGIPVVPAQLATDSDSAVAAAEGFGYPVVLKAVADGLGHKSDIGGVRLGLANPREVRQAHDDVRAALQARGATGIGTLIQPQRSGGVELLVGVVRDDTWGLTMAVGLGGMWVEVLRDSALCVLPAGHAEVRAAVERLRGFDVLRGARGGEPADVDAIVDVAVRIGALAEGIGDQLDSLEVNPLLVRGSTVEALDALITWRPAVA